MHKRIGIVTAILVALLGTATGAANASTNSTISTKAASSSKPVVKKVAPKKVVKKKITYKLVAYHTFKLAHYKAKKEGGNIYSTPLVTKKIHDAKNYKSTIFTVSRSATIISSKGVKYLYYYVQNSKGTVSGWIWHGHLTKQYITPAEKIENKVNHMSLAEKIGQLFVPEVSNNTAAVQRDIKQYHLGGIILMGNNFVGNRSQFKSRLSSYQRSAKIPLTIATDQEGGSVSRLSNNPAISGHSYYLSPQAAYRQGGMSRVLSNYRLQASDMHSLGLNWDFAPVADVSTNPNNYMYYRTFGKSFAASANYIGQAVPAIQSQGVAACLKHFPGYGSATNTHTGAATVNKSLSSIAGQDFLPFKAGINSGVDSVMVTHIIFSKVDPGVPASLSKRDIALLRNNLNFGGVIVSDSLQMGAVSDYVNSHHVYRDTKAFKAGNDVLLTSNFRQGIPQMKSAVAKNQISVSRINQSVERILTMKYKLGLKVY